MKSRSYVVGLTAVVTVWEDGTVDYEIDKSEVTTSIWEDSEYDDADILRDEITIDKSLGF